MAHGPRDASECKTFGKVMALLEEDEEMCAVAAPFAIDELDNEQGIKFEYKVRDERALVSTPETRAEAIEFRDVVG